jgi:hypothetical protein
MHLQESNQGFLVCVMVWIYFQMIRSFLPQTSDFGCKTYSCRQRLPFFAVFLVFLKLFSEFQSHSNSKQTIQACNYREEPELTPDWLFLTVVYWHSSWAETKTDRPLRQAFPPLSPLRPRVSPRSSPPPHKTPATQAIPQVHYHTVNARDEFIYFFYNISKR